MRFDRRIESVLWGTTLILLAVAGVSAQRTLARRGALPEWRAAAILPSPAVSDSLDGLARAIVQRDPFRLDRRPADVRFGTEPFRLVESPRLPRPPLRLTGILGGPPWRAILEGIPGRDGSLLVRAGDSTGPLRVQSVGRDSMVISGLDTTWILRVPEDR